MHPSRRSRITGFEADEPAEATAGGDQAADMELGRTEDSDAAAATTADDAVTIGAPGPWRRTVLLVGPLLLLVAVVAAVVLTDPVGALRGAAEPIEGVAVESVRLSPDRIELSVRNVSQAEVTIAQVMVNDAYWNHDVANRELGRLESTSVTVHYPWEPGLPLHVSLLTSTGTRIDHEVEAAAASPQRDLPTTARLAGLGVLIGVVPVAIGLLWLPALRRLSRRVRDGALGVTAGLLAFLLVDTLEEAFEAAAGAGAGLNAIGLVAVGATAMVATIVLVDDLAGRRAGAISGGMAESTGMAPAYVMALAIGLHNLGEGLAVGAAVAVGEVALGTTLVLGFILHNSTEGLAIAMPLGSGGRVRLSRLVGLVAVAGLPASMGTVAGGWSIAPGWVALALGAAAGAIVQVLWALKPMFRGERTDRRVVAVGFLIGTVVMYATGLLT